MGLGGLARGLLNAGTAQAEGQQQGNLNAYQLQLQAQQLASENALRQAQAGYFSERLPEALQAQGLKNQGALDIQGVKQQMQSEKDELLRQLGEARNDNQRLGLQLQIRRLDESLNQFNIRQSVEQTGKVVSDLKPLEDQAIAIRKVRQLTPQAVQQNPFAARMALNQIFQAGIGGNSFRAQMAALAGAPATASPELWLDNLLQKVKTGGIAPKAWQDATQLLDSEEQGLRQAHADKLQQDMAIYTDASPGLNNRTNAIFGAPPSGSGASSNVQAPPQGGATGAPPVNPFRLPKPVSMATPGGPQTALPTMVPPVPGAPDQLAPPPEAPA